ncbi:hypothetical protein ACOBQB_01910 [Streptomyces sp. G5(2025)]|uniref:hypothetical protein n=1 Tax=Streptomyces sp. G5(2025) TaxID=3406628 RepID=UPI003C299BDD
MVKTPWHFPTPERIAFKSTGTDAWLLQWVIVAAPDGKAKYHCPLLSSRQPWLAARERHSMKDTDDNNPWAVNEVSLFLAPGE